jgi:hypothetical protein
MPVNKAPKVAARPLHLPKDPFSASVVIAPPAHPAIFAHVLFVMKISPVIFLSSPDQENASNNSPQRTQRAQRKSSRWAGQPHIRRDGITTDVVSAVVRQSAAALFAISGWTNGNGERLTHLRAHSRGAGTFRRKLLRPGQPSFEVAGFIRTRAGDIAIVFTAQLDQAGQ